jgi:hypothetical protein
LLVDSSQEDVLTQISLWKQKKTIDTEKLNEWMEKGIIFPGTQSGEKVLFETERKKREEQQKQQHAFPYEDVPSTNVEMFVNIGASKE